MDRAFAVAKWHSLRVSFGGIGVRGVPNWHSRRVSFGVLGTLALTALALSAAGARAASPSSSLPPARPANAPTVLALTTTHPSSAALGSLSAHLSSIGVLSPAWLALEPGGRFAYTASDSFTQGLTERGARLVPVLSDPQRLAGDLLADRPLRRQLVTRLGVALRALGASGVVVDWRDLPPSARAAYPAFLRELRAALGAGSQIVVTVPPIRTKLLLRTGSYDLRALSGPARLLVLAWNEHGPRSEPGPVASLAFWKQTLRTVLRAAPRDARAHGRAHLGLAVASDRGRRRRARRRRPRCSRRPREIALQRRYGARVGEHAWVESDRSVQLKLLTARQANIAGVALWVRGGESSKTWSQPWLEPPSR